MPFKRPNRPNYYVTAVVGGKRIRRSTGTTDRKEAEQIEREWRKEINTPGDSWEAMISAYLDARPNERSAYSVQALLPHFKGKTANAISQLEYRRYVRYRKDNGISDGTIRKELGVARAAINYCRDELGWILPKFPTNVMPKKPLGRVRWLKFPEYQKLLLSAKDNKRAAHLAPFIQLAVNTGMRKGEILGLEWSRVDLARREIYLKPEHQKSKQYDTVPLNDTAVSALLELANDTQWVFQRKGARIQNVRNSFKSACDASGIHDFHIHDLRHTCAAWLVQSGHSLPVVGQVLRHQDLASTAIYAHLSPESARSAIDSLVHQSGTP